MLKFYEAIVVATIAKRAFFVQDNGPEDRRASVFEVETLTRIHCFKWSTI